MKSFCKKNRNNFWFCLCDHFDSCRTFLIIFCGIFLVGVLVGCFSFAKYNKIFGFQNANILNADVFFNNVNFLSFAFKNFLKYFLFLTLAFVFSLNVFLIPLNVFTAGYMGYLLGANLVLMTIFLGAFGVLFMIIIFLPIEICVCFLVINFACFCEKTAFDNRKYGQFCAYRGNLFNSAISFFILICVLVFLLLVLESLILPRSVKNVFIKF